MRCNRQSHFCCLQSNLQVLMIEERKKRAPLIPVASLQFIADCSHLVVKAIEFSNFVFEQRLVLFDANYGKAVDEFDCGHTSEIEPFHGLSTPNLVRASVPTRRRSSQLLPRR